MLNPEGQEGAYFVYEGYPPHNLAIGLGGGRTPEELAAFPKLAPTPMPALAGGTRPNACRIWSWRVEARCSHDPGIPAVLAQGCRVARLLPRLQRLARGVLQPLPSA